VTIRVIIADDQPLMRSALTMSLASEPDIEVVGAAADGRQAVELAEALRPDVLVTDIRMPGLDGIAATRQLRRATNPSPPRILIITTFNLDEYVVEALRAGASGFLLKDATSEQLVHAVRVIAAGEALLDPAVTRRLLDRYARLLPAPVPANPLPASVTARERAVLLLVAQGLSNGAIGQALHLAESSVKTHVGHLLAKLGKQDRVQLVIYAYEMGLVQPTGSMPGPA
jgi:DNA-binding NarL/FixJ family response regulator